MRKLLIMLGLWAASPALAQVAALTPQDVLQPGPPGVPRPALVARTWELTFRYHDPQRVSVIVPGRPHPVVYWYMLYTVENNTAREVEFYPAFELVTDTLQVLPSGLGVSAEAFKAVHRRAGDPFLVTPEKASGRLLRGEESARHGVAIWPDFDPKARTFTVYVAGLSGEVRRIKNPSFEPDHPEAEENKRYFTLRKTLEIPYSFPGSESMRSRAVPGRQPYEQKWIMR